MKKQNKELGKTYRDYSISFTRLIAMCFIVACHIMQRDGFASDINGAHIEWAFWFNIGVQMFLFISGYLYGLKKRIDIVEFYKRSFPKILVDYYVFIFVMLAAIHWSPLMSIDKSSVIALLTFSGTVAGLGHLWFIPTILFCYLIAPIISEVIKAIDLRSDLRFTFESILLLSLIHVMIPRFFGYFSPAWTNCFVIGMLYSRIERRDRLKPFFNAIVVVLCIIIIPIQFRIDYWPHNELPAFFAARYGNFVAYGHVFLGIAFVVLLRFLYRKYTSNTHNHVLLDWSDKYSYDIYLVHHVFTQSAFGCVEFISNRWIAIPLAIMLTLVGSVALNKISTLIRNKCVAAFNKLPN